MKNFKLFFAILVCLLMLNSLTQAGSRYAVATGIWDATTTWSDTRGGAPGASVPSATDTVWIPSPYIVTLTASGKNCYNLIIESGGTLKADNVNPSSNQRYVRVSGDYVQNDGLIGTHPDSASSYTTIGFETNVTGKTVTFKGSGISKISRIRNGSSASNTTLVIDQDLTLTYTGSSGTGGAAWYGNNGTGVNSTFII